MGAKRRAAQAKAADIASSIVDPKKNEDGTNTPLERRRQAHIAGRSEERFDCSGASTRRWRERGHERTVSQLCRHCRILVASSDETPSCTDQGSNGRDARVNPPDVSALPWLANPLGPTSRVP